MAEETCDRDKAALSKDIQSGRPDCQSQGIMWLEIQRSLLYLQEVSTDCQVSPVFFRPNSMKLQFLQYCGGFQSAEQESHGQTVNYSSIIAGRRTGQGADI